MPTEKPSWIVDESNNDTWSLTQPPTSLWPASHKRYFDVINSDISVNDNARHVGVANNVPSLNEMILRHSNDTNSDTPLRHSNGITNNVTSVCDTTLRHSNDTNNDTRISSFFTFLTSFDARDDGENNDDDAIVMTSSGLNWALLCLIVLVVATALGNTLVCVAIGCERRLRTTFNLFLLSLAISDLLVALLVMPLALVVELHGKLRGTVNFT